MRLSTVTPLQIDNTSNKIKRIGHTERSSYNETMNYTNNLENNERFLEDYAMTQMTVREGLKKYGEHGRASVMKEIRNLVSQDCLGEVLYGSLTGKDKKFALPILMFMTMKRD